MTIDPALARKAAAVSACAVLAFLAGCGNQKDRTAAAPGATTAPVAQGHAVRMRAFTPAEIDAARRAPASGLVAVDVLDTRSPGVHQTAVTAAPGDTVHVIGWAYHEAQNTACSDLGLLVDGKRAFPALYGYARPDVAGFYKDPARVLSGYSVDVPAARLGSGAHDATVICLGRNGAPMRYSGTLQITVR